MSFTEEDKGMNDPGDLKDALRSVDPERFVTTAKRIIGDHKFTDDDFDKKYARLRRAYPAYDALCRTIQAQGRSILEETMLHCTLGDLHIDQRTALGKKTALGDVW